MDDVPVSGRAAGPDSRRATMEELASRIGGTLVEGRMPGGYGVAVRHRGWQLTAGPHVVTTGTVSMVHTRVATDFAAREPFRLRIRHRNVFDTVAGWLGLGRAARGDRELASRYVVKGRPESRVRSVLSGGLGAVVMAGPVSTLDVLRATRGQRKRLGPAALRLQVLAPGVDADVDRYVGLIDVARVAMDTLQRSGVAI